MEVHEEIVISFGNGENGIDISALHMDEFPLSFLGPMTLSRASTIDFNPETQLFDINLTHKVTDFQHIRLADAGWKILKYAENGEDIRIDYPEAARGFVGYDEARAYEVRWIQQSKLAGVDPLSSEGIEIIQALREASDSPQL